MVIPTYEHLEKLRDRGWKHSLNGRFIHPQPLFYKYYWWVFYSKSPIEGLEFITEPYQLCSAKAMELMERLEAEQEIYMVYNKRLRRFDPANTPFDYDSYRWADSELALGFADDPDPLVQLGGVMIK